jgi:hypothetical protein
MKPRSDLQQAADASAQPDPALGRFGDAAEDLEKRAFAGPVPADDAQNLALLDLEIHILKGPEFFDLTALRHAAAGDVDRTDSEIAQFTYHDITQRRIATAALAARRVLYKVSLGQIFDSNNHF